MERLIWLFQFLLYFMQYHQVSCSSSISSFSTCTRHLCPPDQRFALLQFKHMFTINSFASNSSFCGDLASPKMLSWNKSCTNCCSWEGVTCDVLTGHVIGLDLSCSQLYGSIHPNSSLFQLSHLQRLNLAFNDFNYSHIPSAFAHFPNLTHLNLSYSSFSGSIPSEIHHLSKLVSLDLSYLGIRLEPHNFRMMLKNLTQLQELVLSYVNIFSVVPMSLTNMSSLTNLDLSSTGLHGKLPDSIFHLPNLQILILGDNHDLTGNLPKVNWSSSSSLRQLYLGYSSFSGELPDSIGYLRSLMSLDLSYCKFSGSIPESLGNLTHITNIYLGGNSFNGQIPFTLSNLYQLISLDLSGNYLHGKIPNFIGKLIKLEYFALAYNNFNGPFPCGVANLTKLGYLDISSSELTGPIPSISGLHNLQTLYLPNNSLTGTLPSWLLNLPSLIGLGLGSNRLTGQIPEFHRKSKLMYIDLSHNELHGPIPQSISNLVNLTDLCLSSNNLSGVVELQTFSNLKNLNFLDLSYNSLSVTTINNINNILPNLWSFRMTSCKIKEFSDFFKALENVYELDISSNEIHGKIPKWVGVIGKASLSYLNLSNNFLTGINQFPWKNLDTLDLSYNLIQGQLPILPLSVSDFLFSQNKLTGEIPSSICNVSSLSILDLSHNHLSGAIPQCLGNFSNILSVLDLRFNAFQGNIPMIFGKGNQLEILNLNGNQFEGPVPRSLTNCRQLQVLDLGNNKINDTFPYWLGILPELRVLVLRSNKFHGPIDTSKPKLYFPKLRIVDLSHNKFTGHLPERYFKNFKAMKNKAMPNEKYLSVRSYYQDSVMVTMKGFDIYLTRILTIFTSIDLSSNKFSGDIPNVIGRLNSLIVLNLSHNSLTGLIPSSLGDLTELESLDLSSNQLIGKIPNHLLSLTFLEVFNLSCNHLDGRIPRGKQFDTFGNDSYVGNLGLCGFPLSKECEDNQSQVQPGVLLQQEDDSNFVSGFTWEAVVMGYACGMPLGLVIGFLMFLTGKPKLFVRIVEGKKHKKVKMLRQRGRRN
ncbi:Receptor-like protein 6 [Camellia lanceoleosa]|uniref:Receptor-like protein 6 n=1 Tax=Camellia lanceoleosa TaxID=1840588 RepID=A0ACC0FIA7_9ERIC|nr:Receptor-like protein 6 [Camellia lanceoleosa]